MLGDLRLDYRNAGIVQAVGLSGVAVWLDGKSDPVARLAESVAQPSSSGKEIDSGGPGIIVSDTAAATLAKGYENALAAPLVLRAADFAPMVNEIDMQALAYVFRNRLLKGVVIRLPTLRLDSTDALEDPVNMSVDSERRTVKRVREDASCALGADPRKGREELFRLAITQ